MLNDGIEIRKKNTKGMKKNTTIIMLCEKGYNNKKNSLPQFLLNRFVVPVALWDIIFLLLVKKRYSRDANVF